MLNTILSKHLVSVSECAGATPTRNWLTFAELANANPLLFRSIWAEFSPMEKAEARETIRLFWVREFEHRQIYGHFLRVTE